MWVRTECVVLLLRPWSAFVDYVCMETSACFVRVQLALRGSILSSGEFMLSWDFQYGLDFLSQMYWTDVWIPSTVNPLTALVKDRPCGEDIRKAGLIRAEMIVGEYIEQGCTQTPWATQFSSD